MAARLQCCALLFDGIGWVPDRVRAPPSGDAKQKAEAICQGN